MNAGFVTVLQVPEILFFGLFPLCWSDEVNNQSTVLSSDSLILFFVITIIKSIQWISISVITFFISVISIWSFFNSFYFFSNIYYFFHVLKENL